jgi:starch synthase
MKDKRILYVSSSGALLSWEWGVLMSYDVPKMINDQGGQIRILCRDGNINERRHQLHEVISFQVWI